jgi:hypothetical protein
VRNMVWHLEMCVMDCLARGDAHSRVVESTAIHGADIRAAPQTYERIVGCHLLVVAIGAGLRQAVQLTSVQSIGSAAFQMLWYMGDVRPPSGLRITCWSVDLKIVCATSDVAESKTCPVGSSSRRQL